MITQEDQAVYAEAAETIHGAIRLFETVGMAAKGLAARTRVEYSSDLREFREFASNRGLSQLGSVSIRVVEAFQAELDGRDLRSSSCNRKAQTLKSFFRFLFQHGVLSENVGARIIPPRVPSREPRFLTEAEYKDLLRACSHHPRDAALIELFLQTGMRLSEVARLTWADIELPSKVNAEPENVGFARVLRKGGKVVQVPLNFKVCRALNNWRHRLPGRPEPEEPVFVSKYWRALSRRAIQVVVTKYLDLAGIHGASVHSLRHTMATHHVARGTDLRTLQETLGHASLATTAMYVSLAKQAQRRALQEHAL